MRKIIAATTLGLFLASGLVSAPAAQAATIKNGVPCTKLGATTKSGGKTYKCGRNPFITPTKKTWAQKTCLDGYQSYLDIKNEMIPQAEDMLLSLAGEDFLTMRAQVEKFTADNAKVYTALQTKWCKKGA